MIESIIVDDIREERGEEITMQRLEVAVEDKSQNNKVLDSLARELSARISEISQTWLISDFA